MADILLSYQRDWWWALAGLGAVALAFRLLVPAERRSLRVSVVSSAMVAFGLLAAELAAPTPMLARFALATAIVLWGLAAIHLASTVVFRGLLPVFGWAAPRIAQDLSFTGLSLVWGFLWLRAAGMDPTQLFATSAVITAVLAFSMQDTLGNVLGGVTLQLDNSLRVGDWVRVDDVSGRVTDVHWRFTSVETRNRELVMVPNSWLMKNRFTVVRSGESGTYAWRRHVHFFVDAKANPERVLEVLERAITDADIAHVLRDPPASAVLMEIASGYRRYTLRYWLANPQFDDPSDSWVRIHALAGLARAGIAPGVPQEERLLIQEDSSWRHAEHMKERERRLAAIRSTELFANLPAQEQTMLAQHLEHAPFAAGDTMTRQGQVAHWLYLIVQGRAKVVVSGPDGPLEVAMLNDGAIFGEMGMLTGEARSATVIAVTSVDCYRLDKAGFAHVLKQRPEIAKEMTAIVESRNLQLRSLQAKGGANATSNHGDLLGRILSFFSQRD